MCLMHGLENTCNGKDAKHASFVYSVQSFKFFPHRQTALCRSPNFIQFSEFLESSLHKKKKKRVSMVNVGSRTSQNISTSNPLLLG